MNTAQESHQNNTADAGQTDQPDNLLARSVWTKVRQTEQVLSPWVQRSLQTGPEPATPKEAGRPRFRQATLTTTHTHLLLNRLQRSTDQSRVWQPGTVSITPDMVDRFATQVATHFRHRLIAVQPEAQTADSPSEPPGADMDLAGVPVQAGREREQPPTGSPAPARSGRPAWAKADREQQPAPPHFMAQKQESRPAWLPKRSKSAGPGKASTEVALQRQPASPQKPDRLDPKKLRLFSKVEYLSGGEEPSPLPDQAESISPERPATPPPQPQKQESVTSFSPPAPQPPPAVKKQIPSSPETRPPAPPLPGRVTGDPPPEAALPPDAAETEVALPERPAAAAEESDLIPPGQPPAPSLQRQVTGDPPSEVALPPDSAEVEADPAERAAATEDKPDFVPPERPPAPPAQRRMAGDSVPERSPTPPLQGQETSGPLPEEVSPPEPVETETGPSERAAAAEDKPDLALPDAPGRMPSEARPESGGPTAPSPPSAPLQRSEAGPVETEQAAPVEPSSGAVERDEDRPLSTTPPALPGAARPKPGRRVPEPAQPVARQPDQTFEPPEPRPVFRPDKSIEVQPVQPDRPPLVLKPSRPARPAPESGPPVQRQPEPSPGSRPPATPDSLSRTVQARARSVSRLPLTQPPPGRPPITARQARARLVAAGWRFKRNVAEKVSDPRLVSRSVESLERPASGGRPLPEEARATAEEKLGRDFSPVRLHTASLAPLQVEAASFERDVYLEPGRDRFETPQGRALLGHELTHVARRGLVQTKPVAETTVLSPPEAEDTPEIQREEAEAVETEQRLLADKPVPSRTIPLTGAPHRLYRKPAPVTTPPATTRAEEAGPVTQAVELPSPVLDWLASAELAQRQPLASPPDIPPVVQRAELSAGAVAERQPAADEQADTDEAGAEPDLDKLARQIYPLLRRMLAVERERRAARPRGH